MDRAASNDNSWVKPRHKVIRAICYPVIWLMTHLRYRIKIDKLPRSKRRQYLIIFNHQTPYDQFFVSLAFPDPVYYIASEDLFSIGFLARMMSYAVAPIPIKKQVTDVVAVKNCMRVAKQGGTIALAPEGNRTYSGRTCYMNPAIAALVKKLRLPVAVFRIEGGFGAEPRWSNNTRKGPVHAYISRIIEPEELKALDNDEVAELINKELWVDEAKADVPYPGKKLAENIERAAYVCPYCGLSKFESKGDVFRCTRCGREGRYLPSKELEGLGYEFPFRFYADWFDYQCDFVRALDLSRYIEKPMFTDSADISRVILYKRKERICKGAALKLYGDRITVQIQGKELWELKFADISAASVLGRNKLNIYYGDNVYQFKGDRSFNALKYVNIYYHYKNTNSGGRHGRFLGL